jgi:23S rRNA pseudouridine1911/1915/1917 synthase
MEQHLFSAPPKGGRLDKWLAEKLELSRSRAHWLIKEGHVLVDGRKTRPSHRLRLGEELTVSLPPLPPSELVPQDIPLDIVYEDSHVIVVNKAAGMVVHPGAGNPDGTLANAILSHISEPCGEAGRPGIVHRIDKGTSGLIVVARTEEALSCLQAQFAARSIGRSYLALVWRRPDQDTGTIDEPLGRHPVDRIRFAVREGGRHAVTHYRLLLSGGLEGIPQAGLVSLLQCRLETGRTHQIRVHLQSIGHPIFGDPVYSRASFPPQWNRIVKDIDHQLLHAWKLAFVHPDGRELSFEARPPGDFLGLLSLTGMAWPSCVEHAEHPKKK